MRRDQWPGDPADEPNDDDIELQNELWLYLEMTAPVAAHELRPAPFDVWTVVVRDGEPPEISANSNAPAWARRRGFVMRGGHAVWLRGDDEHDTAEGAGT